MFSPSIVSPRHMSMLNDTYAGTCAPSLAEPIAIPINNSATSGINTNGSSTGTPTTSANTLTFNNDTGIRKDPSEHLDTSNRNILAPPNNVPKRGHRHRRSAAISGDFDTSTFLQPPTSNLNSHSLSKSLPSSPIRNSSNGNSINDLLLESSSPNKYSPCIANSAFSNLHNNINNNNNNNNNNSNNNKFNPSSNLSSTPIKLYLTEETRFSDSNSNIPDAMIDLDDINHRPFNSSSLPTSSTGNQLFPSLNLPPLTPTNQSTIKFSHHLPKHSILCSPKKQDVMIVEEITEENNTFHLEDDSFIDDLEDNDSSYENLLPNSASQNDYHSMLMSKHLNNSLTSIPTKNSQTSSLASSTSNQQILTSSSSPNPFSNVNTPSISSLKGKVRYQSYYTQNYNYNYNYNLPSTPKNNSQPPFTQRLNNSTSMSPIKPSIKSPFRYQTLQYDLPDNFHTENHQLDIDIHVSSDCDVSREGEAVEQEKDQEEKDGENTKGRNKNSKTRNSDLNSVQNLSLDSNSNTHISSSSTLNLSTNSNSNSKSKEKIGTSNSIKLNHKHERSNSFFSILSKKISHHKRKSSTISNYTEKSIIEQQTNDELLGLNTFNDSTLNEDYTITPDCLGEPGPMIEISSNEINKQTHSSSPLSISTSSSNARPNNASDNHYTKHYQKQSSSHKHNSSHNHSHSHSLSHANTKTHHHKKGLFGWMIKKKDRVHSQ